MKVKVEPPRTKAEADPGALYQQIYALVRSIPRGRVATYGQIAALLGKPRSARQVGYALAASRRQPDLPWHRVVNALGGISRRANADDEQYQRILLESEGVGFDLQERVQLARYQWQP
jgi:methylated-DNA-protein-cysteine methyltransferase-like protein